MSTQPPSPIQLKGEMTLVSLWRRSDANVGEVVNVVVGIIDPAGNDLAKTAFTVDLNSGLICRQVTKIEALIVRGSGLHFLDIQQLNPTTGATTRVARLPLEVILKAMT